MSILEMTKCIFSIVDHESIMTGVRMYLLNEKPPRKHHVFEKVSLLGDFLSIFCESLVGGACLDEIPHCMW